MTVGSVGWLGEEKSMLFADSTSALQTSKGRWCEKSSKRAMRVVTDAPL